MRVITGSARGAHLKTLESYDIRPTADRVKEAVFNILQFELEGRQVLDLFAGSGQLGIEALSRGASRCVFIDQSAQAVSIIKENLAHTRLLPVSSVVHSDYLPYLPHCKAVFDVAFLDPPYGKGLIDAALPLVAPLMSPHGVIVCEAAKKDEFPERAGEFTLVKLSGYGKTAVGVYRQQA